MLHEILLSLSGYHSEIWDKLKEGALQDNDLQKYVSEPEKAMLEVLANISRSHIQVRDNAERIAATHKSVICRAVGSAMSEQHLTAFRRKVLEVESSILKRDASYVGAYGIVPLSTVVGEFAPWSRRLEWLLNITKRMEPRTESATDQPLSTGKNILDFLQNEIYTGYSDIEEMAKHLLVCAQKVWMRSLASWVLYGKLPSFGADDFFIRHNASSKNSVDDYIVDSQAQPKFVSDPAVGSILAIGNALTQIRTHGQSMGSLTQSTSQSMARLSQHLQLLEGLTYPLNSAALEAAMTAIDQSISQNDLSRLLPLEQILDVLGVIHRFVLLGSGEFAVSLIEHGAAKVASKQFQGAKPMRKVGRLDDFAVKDADLSIILTKTWDELAAFQLDQGLDDGIFVLARLLLTLHGVDASEDGQGTVSTWLPSPALLDFSLPADSTLSLMLSPQATRTYSAINAYLLSVRRAELQLSSLWKVTSQRRCHPTPIGPPRSATRIGQQVLASRRAREDARSAIMRQHWVSANKALFLVNEFGGYLHGEVIGNSWHHFDLWIREGVDNSRPGSSRSHDSRPGTASSLNRQFRTSQLSDVPSNPWKARDPRTLAQGHNAFLKALHAGLLLTHDQFVAEIKEFLNLIDHFVALFHRLQTIWEGLDMQEDDGIEDAFSNYAEDEKSVLSEMARTRGLLEEALKNLLAKLKDAEKERILDEMASDVTQLTLERQRFLPWKPRTMDRLIMKLDLLAGGRDMHNENDGVDAFDDE